MVSKTKVLVSQSAFFAIPLAFSVLAVQAYYKPVSASTLDPDCELELRQPLGGANVPPVIDFDLTQSAFSSPDLLSGASSAWLARSVSKIEGMENLEHGWDGYQADPPSTTTIDQARTILQTLYRMNLEPNRVAASAEGGITLAFYNSERYGDIELLNSGEVLAITSSGNGNPEVWEVSGDKQIKEALGKIRDYIRCR